MKDFKKTGECDGGNDISNNTHKAWFSDIEILPNLPTSKISFILSSEESHSQRSGWFPLKDYIANSF